MRLGRHPALPPTTPPPPPLPPARCLPQVRAAQALQGKVVSTAQNKTAVVEVSTLQIHPVYQKRVRVTTKVGAAPAAAAALARRRRRSRQVACAPLLRLVAGKVARINRPELRRRPGHRAHNSRKPPPCPHSPPPPPQYNAHDEQQQCQVGDMVTLAPSRPLSKTKR